MFSIISDGGCDFSVLEIQKNRITVVPFYIQIDEHTSVREGIDISKEDYFHRLRNEKDLKPKTAQPSPQDYLDAIFPLLESGLDAMILTISSKLSGSYQSATLAAGIAMEKFAERKVLVVDSQSASMGQSLILREMIAMRDDCFSIQDTFDISAKVIQTTNTYFTLDTLEFLKRGGRVGSTTAFVGGILGLRPILQLKEGVVAQLENVRGKKKVMSLLIEAISYALEDDKENVHLNIGQILSEDDSVNLRDKIEEALNIEITTPITEIGAAVGTHAGPGALGLAYCKKYTAILAEENENNKLKIA